MALPTFAAECQRLLDGAVQQTIDISCWQGAQQQTRCKPQLLAIDGTDRRMYRLQTYKGSSIDPAPHDMRTASIILARRYASGTAKALVSVCLSQVGVLSKLLAG